MTVSQTTVSQTNDCAQAIAHDIAIVGGGFAGAVTALRLVEASTAPLDLVIVEPAARLARGIAYATDEPDHTVNGLAAGFILRAGGSPQLFLDWLRAEAEAGRWNPPAGDIAHTSPPRALYGAYAERELARAVRGTQGRVRLVHRRDRAVDLDGHALTLASGATLAARQVVLATGLHRRAPALAAGLADHPAYVGDIFALNAFESAGDAAHVLLLGSGLSMLDAVVSLEKCGFRGHYTVVSRRGLVVAPRREVAPWPGTPEAAELPREAGAVLSWIRRERRAVAAAGQDWQGLPPLFRQLAAPIWAGLDNRAREKLLRRLLPFWNLAMHRAAAPSYAFFARAQAAGRVRSLAGTLSRLDTAGSGLRATLRPKGGGVPLHIDADLVVSTLGFEFDWTRIDDPLVRSLLRRGLAVPHPVGVGVRADPTTQALIDIEGRISDTLFAVGHPLRGELFEASSLNEQIHQATRLAGILAARLAPSAAASPARQVA
ncbi:FAD/NAD(P)-binding protein [Ancylobacter sonchi]|uniref:FAD/NAD(P)-binding protein n=1 Tax=Ancylobacter sonchi TaxID=1937790 RepID=UPI001BD5FBAC|nr:FAD/NAD(P)-binding protein [Ancylobacter sonchi]MBS7534459.1 FAD/NAD(P)-binding protein [Ancylobacter sonchi]